MDRIQNMQSVMLILWSHRIVRCASKYNSYGLEEEQDSKWALLSVMDIPIATAFTRNLQVATTVIAQLQGMEFCHQMFK
ncbi:unnamed protein product [Sphagnum balticum]